MAPRLCRLGHLSTLRQAKKEKGGAYFSIKGGLTPAKSKPAHFERTDHQIYFRLVKYRGHHLRTFHRIAHSWPVFYWTKD